MTRFIFGGQRELTKHLIESTSLSGGALYFNIDIALPDLTVTHIAAAALLAITATVYWIEFLKMPQHFRVLRRKPFNCQSCLPFWFCVVVLPFPTIMLFTIGGALATGIITPFIIKWLRS